MPKRPVNYKTMPSLSKEDFQASMKEYAQTLYAAVKDIPEPETIKREPEEEHGKRCVCEDCFALKIAKR